MKHRIRRFFSFFLVCLVLLLGACSNQNAGKKETSNSLSIQINGSYTSKEEVALFLHTYGELPSNYITKKEAQKLGWDSKQGNLWDVAPGKSIGGSYFGNYEEELPDKKGREWKECDIDYSGGKRNAKRIVFSNDGLIYYTGDHYKTFQQLSTNQSNRRLK